MSTGWPGQRTKIFLKYKASWTTGDWLNSAIARATFIETQADRVDALKSPSVIITTAGMLNGGPVVDYITKLNQNSAIFISGFQVEGTNGRLLLDKGTINVDGKERKVHLRASTGTSQPMQEGMNSTTTSRTAAQEP